MAEPLVKFHTLFGISEQFELSVGVTSICRAFYILIFVPAIRFSHWETKARDISSDTLFGSFPA